MTCFNSYSGIWRLLNLDFSWFSPICRLAYERITLHFCVSFPLLPSPPLLSPDLSRLSGWLLFPSGSQSVHASASFRFMVSHLTPAWPQSPVYLGMTWNSESSGAHLPSGIVMLLVPFLRITLVPFPDFSFL